MLKPGVITISGANDAPVITVLKPEISCGIAHLRPTQR